MSGESLRVLLLPFAEGLLPMPGGGRGVLLRAEPAPELDAAWRDALVCEQSFKPHHDGLAAAGFRVERRLEDTGRFDAALCLLTKHKAESLANVARAWAMLEPGGVLVCCGAKDSGAASVEKQLRQALGELEGGLSKSHCRVFWARKTAEAMPALLTGWLAEGEARLVPETGFVSRPGLFGWNKVDEGSRLLAEHMPARLSGAVADLGAGWGYLTTELLRRCPKATRIDLYEAEWLALEAARENVGRLSPAIPIGFNWQDVTAPGIPRRSYDRVVTNPPFHAGKATEHDLGRAFILAAAEALRPGGTMLLVANRHLPYEAVIEQKFRGKAVLAESSAFKVIEARL